MPEDRDNTSPNIVLLQNLTIDREDAEIVDSGGVSQYFLSVSDAGGNHAYKQLIFNVNDLNDLDPEFSELPTGTEVYENEEIGTVVTTVRAEDPDVSNDTIR